jgi:nitrate reductase gamma subunit
VLHRKFGGLVHLCVFSAFIVLFIVTCLVAVEYDLGIRILDGNFYIVFKLFAETFGAVLLIGVAGALVRRIVFRPPGLTKENDDTLQLLLIGAIGVTGFLIETARIAATHPAIAPISFIGNAVAPALFGGMPLPAILSAHKALWWTHLLIAFGFLASLPFTKMVHMGTGTAASSCGPPARRGRFNRSRTSRRRRIPASPPSPISPGSSSSPRTGAPSAAGARTNARRSRRRCPCPPGTCS